MNSLIETLNAWADQALRLAWPMLWQSSLLIILLFTLDLLMKRKVRPAVRYALWLVVLVKLLLPPSLALPTSPGWWMHSARAVPAAPSSTSVVVSYGEHNEALLPVAPTLRLPAPPAPSLTLAAWGFIGTVTLSLGLFAWMLFRWQQVAGEARRAAEAPAWLNELLSAPQHHVRLRLTDRPQSPAVCGLVRPVILLPRSLAERLPASQLRAVLLHELFHLRRGDAWVNCAQALLQIAYWWHPLLWLANARIRRLREEAVDDAVMLALNEEAETYAPTLLEVARLARPRPLASLGRVGILESRRSLRQRIERLMDFRPPRKAGLSLGAVLAVIGFAALAVPMGQAPAPAEVPQSAESEAATNSFPLPTSTNAASFEQKLTVSTLVQDGKLLYEMGKLNEAQAKLEQALDQDPQNQVAVYYLNLVRDARLKTPATNGEVHPTLNLYALTNKFSGDSRRAIMRKLDSIRLARVSFDELPLSEVARFLTDETRKSDPDKLGVNFSIKPSGPVQAPPEASLDPVTGLPKPATPARAVDPSSITITIKPPLTNIRLADVLDAVVKTANQPIKYSIDTNGIAFAARTGKEPPPLYVRTFKVDLNAALDRLHLTKVPVPVGTNGVGTIVSAAFLDYFKRGGVDLDQVKTPGKALFYNASSSMLVVRAALHDIDIIEQMLSVLIAAQPQINIKCKFVEVSQDYTKPFGFGWYVGNMLMTNGAIGGQAGTAPTTIAPNSTNQPWTSGSRISSTSFFTPTGILTEPQFRVVIKALQQRSGTELLAQPEFTTTSGRQAQMKTVDVGTVVTGINKRALTPPGITVTNGEEGSLYVTEKMELGPVLDVIPSVLPDGYTIELMVIPTVTEFLGYEENPTNRVAVYVNGKKKWVIPPQPKFRVGQMCTNVRVWDGQTVVLGGLLSETVATIKDQVPMLGDLPLLGWLFRSESKTIQKKNLLVFVTPTLIDPAGNRVHSEEDLPCPRAAAPPQPPR